MANERATNEQLEERHELAASLLADGIPHHKVVQQLAVAYKVSPQQARDYVREAKKLVLHQFDENDIKFEILQCLDDLKQDIHQKFAYLRDRVQAGNSFFLPIT